MLRSRILCSHFKSALESTKHFLNLSKSFLWQTEFFYQRLSFFKNHHLPAVHIFPQGGICTADLSDLRGACQSAPTSRQTCIQKKLKEAGSGPPSPFTHKGEGDSTSPGFVSIFFSLQQKFPFVILLLRIGHRKQEIKTWWWLGMTVFIIF